jgi:hypothetical protein
LTRTDRSAKRLDDRERISAHELLVGALIFAIPTAVLVQEPQRRPQPGTTWTEEQLKKAVAPMRAGRKLTPNQWPNGARVAVCLSFDVDNETFELAVVPCAPTAAFPRVRRNNFNLRIGRWVTTSAAAQWVSRDFSDLPDLWGIRSLLPLDFRHDGIKRRLQWTPGERHGRSSTAHSLRSRSSP